MRLKKKDACIILLPNKDVDDYFKPGYIYWNLKNDNLNNQDTETISWLLGMLE